MRTPKGLIGHRDFVKLWAGQTVSQLGSQITLLALPTVAILILHATPFQVGILGALQYLAFPIFGLLAGAYADRLPRKPILIICDLGRMIALAFIPVVCIFGTISMTQLYVVAGLMGLFTVFFDVAYQSYLPALIDRTALLEGNTKLEISNSAAQVAGPSMAGILIQLIGGAKAIAVDSFTYLISAIAVFAIRKSESVLQGPVAHEAKNLWIEIKEGLHVVFSNPILRSIVGCTAFANLGYNIASAVVLLFIYRVLHLTPQSVGIILGLSGFGFLFGSFLAQTCARALGFGPALAFSILVGGIAIMAKPLAILGAPVATLLVLWTLEAFVVPIYNINQVSFRQAIVPDRLQGRMNATVQAIIWGVMPVGQFLGGVLASRISFIPTLLLGGLINVLASAWLFFGPVWKLKEHPIRKEDGAIGAN